MNKLWYSWEEMRRDVNVLARDIVLDKFDPKVIVGLSRGGLTPGVMLSHWFKKPFKPVKSSLRDFPEWEDYLPKPTDERVLIVDDISSLTGTIYYAIQYRNAGGDGNYASAMYAGFYTQARHQMIFTGIM